MLLISLLLVVMLGVSVSAVDPNFQFSPSLTIELVVPEDIKVNEPFWVDVYVTPALKDKISDTRIDLKTSSGDLYFVGDVMQIEGDIKKIVPGLLQGEVFEKGVGIEKNEEGTWVMMSSVGEWRALLGKKKMVSIRMQAKKPGTYSIELIKYSFSYYEPKEDKKYFLSMSPVSVCVPVLKCPNEFDCGYKDNGCGQILACNACAQPKYCVDNVCTDLVVVTKSPEDTQLCQNVIKAPSHEKTLLAKISSALNQYKDYKMEFSEITEALVEWFKAAKVPQP